MVREGAKHAVAASKRHRGAKPSQGGTFTDHLLCSDHENLTAAPDKYGVEFVRRVTDAWGDRKQQTTLEIDNPEPQLLRSFTLLTIWREIHSLQLPRLSLGPYENAVRRHLFQATSAPDWPVIAQRTNFLLPARGAIDFNLHPYRVRFADCGGWMLTVAGIAFFVITDRRGIPDMFSEWRVDEHDPAIVTVSEPLPFTEIGALKVILANMASKAPRNCTNSC
jgi:hypothetical protein